MFHLYFILHKNNVHIILLNLKTRKKNSRYFSVFHLTLNVYLSPRDDVHDLLISLILISGTFWELDTKILENNSLELYVTYLQTLLKQSWTNVHDKELHNIIFRILVRILCSWGKINFQMYRENSFKHFIRFPVTVAF